MVIIGVDMGGTRIKAGRVYKGRITKYISKKTHARTSQEEVMSQLFKIIDTLMSHNVKFICIGVPGIVNEHGTVVSLTNIHSWYNVPLKKILEKKYGRPVFIENDANCFILGEKYFGKAKKFRNIVGIIMGTGAGAGIIINNQLYEGLAGGAGEFGAVEFRHKTIEDYCSGKFFLWKYHLTGINLFDRVRKGEHKAMKIFREFGENIGKELAIVVDSIAPELIILGGSIAKSYTFFKKAMLKSLKEEISDTQFSKLKIKVSTNKNIAILGASTLHKEYLKEHKW